MRLFGQQPFVKSDELKDTNLRAAAELIDEQVGKKNDKTVTPKDLEKMRDLITRHDAAATAQHPEKSPLSHLMLTEIEIVRKSLDGLDAAMHAPKLAVGRRVFCTSLLVSAIADPKVRETAAQVARAIGKGPDQLNLKELDDARAAIQSGALKGIDMNAFSAIETFMFTGKGGLVTFGPVYVSGHRFDTVYKLPVERGLGDAKLRKAIADFEQRFKETGYDRVYVKNDAGDLFIALNGKGALKRVEPHFRAQFRDDGELKDSGEVLHVADVDNSMKEATIGFWSKLLRKVIEGVRAAATKKETGEALLHAAEGTKEEDKKMSPQQMQSLAIAGGMVASMGVATLNAPVAAVMAVATGLIATAANVAVMAQTGKDMTAVLHAVGVTVNRDEAVRG
jgi:hypothetical protein